MTVVSQSNWYVFGICWKKKPNAVHKAVNIGFGIWLVYESCRKVMLSQTTVYRVVGIWEIWYTCIIQKKPYKDVYQPFFFALNCQMDQNFTKILPAKFLNAKCHHHTNLTKIKFIVVWKLENILIGVVYIRICHLNWKWWKQLM